MTINIKTCIQGMAWVMILIIIKSTGHLSKPSIEKKHKIIRVLKNYHIKFGKSDVE